MKKYTKQEWKNYFKNYAGYDSLLGFTKSGSAVIANNHPFSGTRYFIQSYPESLGKQISNPSKYIRR